MIKTIGIDLGKSVFHAIGMDETGIVALRKRFSRTKLVEFMANLPVCVVAMEACCGSHHLGRKLAAQGHAVRLIPAQFVRPFVKSNKNDFVDAEAIAEAAQRPTMRFVALKSEDQLDVQALHRVRDRLVSRRTGVINQLRAFLLERGFPIQKGRRYLNSHWSTLINEIERTLTPRMFQLVSQLRQEWQMLEEQIERLGKEIERIARLDPDCARLVGIPGVGPMVATALVSAIGNGTAFSKGRDLSAWLGLVPRQHTTGGKPKLLGISKRGNEYIRRLLIHGARSVIRLAHRGAHGLGSWITSLEKRAHANVVAVGLANKIARICWAVLAHGEAYRPLPAINAG